MSIIFHSPRTSDCNIIPHPFLHWVLAYMCAYYFFTYTFAYTIAFFTGIRPQRNRTHSLTLGARIYACVLFAHTYVYIQIYFSHTSALNAISHNLLCVLPTMRMYCTIFLKCVCVYVQFCFSHTFALNMISHNSLLVHAYVAYMSMYYSHICLCALLLHICVRKICLILVLTHEFITYTIECTIVLHVCVCTMLFNLILNACIYRMYVYILLCYIYVYILSDFFLFFKYLRPQGNLTQFTLGARNNTWNPTRIF